MVQPVRVLSNHLGILFPTFLQPPRPLKFGQPSRDSRHPSEAACAFLTCEACGSVETRHVVRGATTRGGQSTGRKLEGVWGVGWECNTRRPFSLGMGAGRGTAFSALPSPSVAVCGSVGQRSLLAKMSLVNALESGTGEAPCQGVSGVPVQGGEDGLLGKNPVFGRRTPFLPGLSSLASPPALRKQCLVPIYSTSVNY